MSETKAFGESLTPEYFAGVYAANDDPWQFETSEYEREKYAATLAALPKENYSNAFEIGCSIGVLTEKLAARCARLLAVDVSEKALAKAQTRCRNLPQVEFKILQVPAEFPGETFDLILVSEVGYYLSVADWRTTVDLIVARLAPGGTAALVHWTPFVPDYPQTGDAVHDAFKTQTSNRLKLLRAARDKQYRLDVYERL